MDSSHTPRAKQKNMNQPATEDEVVDLTGTDDQDDELTETDDQFDEPTEANDQAIEMAPTDDRFFNRPGVREPATEPPQPRAQVINRSSGRMQQRDLPLANDQTVNRPRGREPVAGPPQPRETVVNRSPASGQVVSRPPTQGQVVNRPPTQGQVVSKPPTQGQVVNRPSAQGQVVSRPPTQGQVVKLSKAQEQVVNRPRVQEPIDDRPVVVSKSRSQPIKVDAGKKRPRKGRKSRRKVLWIGFAAIFVLSVAAGFFSQSSSSGILGFIGKATHSSTPTANTPKATTVPTTATLKPRATPKPKSTPVPVHTTAQALILLNPGVVRQGVSMGVTGTGFDPRATMDLLVKQRAADTGVPIGMVRSDRYGTFYANLTVPQNLSSGTFFIVAKQQSGVNKVAQAAGVVAGGQPTLKLSGQVGKPGDMITVSAHGFGPDETIKVYWNTMIGQPFMTLQADGGGGIGQATVQVPFGAAGVNTFLFVGAKSQSMVAATFDLLSLYPTVKISNYSIRAGNTLSFSGAGFGPGERVLVYLNSANGQPIAVIQTTQKGAFANAGSMPIPFSLKGKQSLIFLGEESRASVAVAWTVQPYMPSAQASTYGGLPGTAVSFYASGFARQEIVHVYVGHTGNNAGNMVSCFRSDEKGNVVNAGSYVVPGDAQGKIVFTLVGAESDGVATATMSIMAAPAPVQVPAQPPFTCPLDGTH